MTSGICFTLGVVGFAIGIVRSAVLSGQLTWLVAGAFVVMAAARFVPLGAAQIVIGVAGIAALWPLAYEMWTHAHPRQVEPSRAAPPT